MAPNESAKHIDQSTVLRTEQPSSDCFQAARVKATSRGCSPEDTTSRAAPTCQSEGVMRSMRYWSICEQSGVGMHYRDEPTRMHRANTATPSWGRHSWHYKAQPSQQPLGHLAIRDDYGPGGAAVVGWILPPPPTGPHDSFGLLRSGGAAGGRGRSHPASRELSDHEP